MWLQIYKDNRVGSYGFKFRFLIFCVIFQSWLQNAFLKVKDLLGLARRVFFAQARGFTAHTAKNGRL